MSDDCIFCSIGRKELACDAVYEDEQVIAFRDLNPQAPTHVLVIPKDHVESLLDAGPDQRDLMGHLLLTCLRVAKETGVDGTGFRVVANCGADGGQTVDHLHLHVLGGRGMTWPPG
jgi:histidine triad (HIT) family protein